MIQSVLVVCVGNICRSPAAEKLFQHTCSDKLMISSAGLGAVVGHAIDEKMQQCLIDAGITELAHKARQLTPEIAQQADLILAMEKAHVHQITLIAPHAHGKTLLLGKWAGDAEVPDPYQRDEAFFAQVYREIDQHVNQWVSRLAGC